MWVNAKKCVHNHSVKSENVRMKKNLTETDGLTKPVEVDSDLLHAIQPQGY